MLEERSQRTLTDDRRSAEAWNSPPGSLPKHQMIMAMVFDTLLLKKCRLCPDGHSVTQRTSWPCSASV